MEETRMNAVRKASGLEQKSLDAVPRKEWTKERYDNLQTAMKQFNGNTIWETIKK